MSSTSFFDIIPCSIDNAAVSSQSVAMSVSMMTLGTAAITDRREENKIAATMMTRMNREVEIIYNFFLGGKGKRGAPMGGNEDPNVESDTSLIIHTLDHTTL